MIDAHVISYDAYDSFEGFSEEQFGAALAASAVKYREWVYRILVARAKARAVLDNELLFAASLTDELRPSQPMRPIEHNPFLSPSESSPVQNPQETP